MYYVMMPSSYHIITQGIRQAIFVPFFIFPCMYVCLLIYTFSFLTYTFSLSILSCFYFSKYTHSPKTNTRQELGNNEFTLFFIKINILRSICMYLPKSEKFLVVSTQQLFVVTYLSINSVNADGDKYVYIKSARPQRIATYLFQ